MAQFLKHRQILGAAIRQLRYEADLTQERLAEKANLSTVFINRVEAAKENISVDSLQQIAIALSVDLRDLFRHAGPPP